MTNFALTSAKDLQTLLLLIRRRRRPPPSRRLRLLLFTSRRHCQGLDLAPARELAARGTWGFMNI